MMNTTHLLALIVATTVIVGCSKHEPKTAAPPPALGPQAEEARLAAERAQYSSALQSSMKADTLNGCGTKVKIGMTPGQARCVLGEPERINATTTAAGVSEQWVYSLGKYVYFRDGLVEAVQD